MRFPLRRSNLDENGRLLRITQRGADGARKAPGEPITQIDPALPFNLPLKSQFSGSDARADRLIRQLRGEVESIRGALDQYARETGDMLEVDLAAVVADPAAAATLPPAALVRALVAAAAENERLQSERGHHRRRALRLRKELREMRIAEAAVNARLGTLEEVIAALHANLEDLRAARDSGPARIAAAPAALELPDAWSALERE